MAEDDRHSGGDLGNSDSHRAGPHERPLPSPDEDRAAPIGVGQWSYADDTKPIEGLPLGGHRAEEVTQVLPPQPQPAALYRGIYDDPAGMPRDHGSSPWPGQGWAGAPPAPSGVPALQPLGSGALPPAAYPPAVRQGRRFRGAGVIIPAAVTALVIGGAAGYGGSRLAARTEAVPQSSAAPTSTAPSSSSAPSAPSSPFTPAPGQPNLVEVSRTVLPSTVMIQVGSGTSGGTGSGFVLDREGRIMTNNHVVAAAGDGARIRVMFSDGSRRAAQLVGRSPSYDLAVIKVDSARVLTPMRVGDSDASRVGEPVIAVGSPLGLPGTVTAGIVSAKNRPVVVSDSADADAASAYINGIQTDAPINPGNSGGPLIDAQARVIGVNSAILTLGASRGQSGSIGLGFAIPINQAMEIGRLLIQKGKATYPVIGAQVEDSDNGVRLTSVDARGPAASAGLREGDVVTSIDDAAVTDVQQLIVTIRTHRPGERINLGVKRGGSTDKAVVILGGREG